MGNIICNLNNYECVYWFSITFFCLTALLCYLLLYYIPIVANTPLNPIPVWTSIIISGVITLFFLGSAIKLHIDYKKNNDNYKPIN